MKIRLALFLSFLIISFFANAQFAERIVTAQPGNTIGAVTVGKRILQFQQGYTLQNMRYNKPVEVPVISTENITNAVINGFTRHVQNNTFRYGLFERLELRGRLSYRKTNDVLDGNSAINFNSGESLDVDFGFRLNIVSKSNLGLNIALQADLGPSYTDLSKASAYTRFNIFLLASKRFGDDFIFTLNTGFGGFELGNDELIARGSLRYFFQNWLFHLGYSRNQLVSNASNLNLHTNGYFFAMAYYLNDDVILNIDCSYQNTKSGRFFLADGTINEEQFYNIGMGISWRLNFRN